MHSSPQSILSKLAKMKRTIFILLLTLSCPLLLLAQVKNDPKQPKCNLPLERAPELRGFSLGTPVTGVLARFPGTALEKPDKFGVAQLRLTVVDTGTTPKGLPKRDRAVEKDITSTPGAESAFVIDVAKFPALKGVAGIRLRFVDGRTSFVEVAYDNSIKWNSIDDFVETVAKRLNLPGGWLAPAESGSDSQKELRCEGFVITGSLGSESTDTRVAAQLSVEDLAASKLVEKRENDLKDKAKGDEDAKRKNFKP